MFYSELAAQEHVDELFALDDFTAFEETLFAGMWAKISHIMILFS